MYVFMFRVCVTLKFLFSPRLCLGSELLPGELSCKLHCGVEFIALGEEGLFFF